MRSLALSLALFACTPADRVTVEDFVQSECPDDTDPPPEALLLVGGDSRITVAHRGYPANCCVELSPVATLDQASATIGVVYEEDGEPCDCMCSYDLGYSLVEVPAGQWTVTANGESALVTVD